MITKRQSEIARLLGYGAVYFIHIDGDDTYCKVGYSQSPARRLSDLQMGTPLPMKIADAIFLRWRLNFIDEGKMWSMDGLSPKEYEGLQATKGSEIHPLDLEEALHKHYKTLGLHHRGEWYKGGCGFLVSEAKKLLKGDFPQVKYEMLKTILRKTIAFEKEGGLR